MSQVYSALLSSPAALPLATAPVIAYWEIIALSWIILFFTHILIADLLSHIF